MGANLRLELDPEECETLAAALRSYLSNLRAEVAGTEREAMRDSLKRQEAVLQSILEQLPT